MPVKKDGRRPLSRATGATSPSQSMSQSVGVAHSTSERAKVSVSASRLASTVLYFSSFGCLAAAFVELTEPAHPLHAGLLVLAAIAVWALAEVVGR